MPFLLLDGQMVLFLNLGVYNRLKCASFWMIEVYILLIEGVIWFFVGIIAWFYGNKYFLYPLVL
jgi:hypothetical protein